MSLTPRGTKTRGNLGEFHCVVKSRFTQQNTVFYEIFEVIDRAISSPAQSATLSPLRFLIYAAFTIACLFMGVIDTEQAEIPFKSGDLAPYGYQRHDFRRESKCVSGLILAKPPKRANVRFLQMFAQISLTSRTRFAT